MMKFGSEDITYLHSAIQTLPKKESEAIVFRFWHCLTIEEIAHELRVSWDEADKLIQKAQKLLKKEIINIKNKTKGNKNGKNN